jgi:hypothetical protein
MSIIVKARPSVIFGRGEGVNAGCMADDECCDGSSLHRLLFHSIVFTIVVGQSRNLVILPLCDGRSRQMADGR